MIGRAPAINDVLEALVRGPVVTITGLGGVGKSRLARELIDHPDIHGRLDAVLVDLSGATDPAQVPERVAAALDIRQRAQVESERDAVADDDLDDLVDQIVEVVGEHPMVVLIDNAERVVDGVAALVRRVAGAAREGGSRIVVTSRVPLGISGERRVLLAPLPVPEEDATDSEIADAPAVQLLAQLTDRVHTPADRRAAARLACAVAGLPLGIELAAQLVRQLPLDAVADGLDERVLGLAASGGTDRLRGVFDWVTERLDADDVTVFARLSVFAGPFTVRSATAVADAGDLTVPVIASLGHLREAALLATVPDEPLAFRLDSVQRAYAQELLAERGESVVLGERLVAWYRSLTAELAPAWRNDRQVVAMEVMNLELGNVRDLLHRLPVDGHGDAALDTPGRSGTSSSCRGTGSRAPAGWTRPSMRRRTRRLLGPGASSRAPGPAGRTLGSARSARRWPKHWSSPPSTAALISPTRPGCGWPWPSPGTRPRKDRPSPRSSPSPTTGASRGSRRWPARSSVWVRRCSATARRRERSPTTPSTSSTPSGTTWRPPTCARTSG